MEQSCNEVGICCVVRRAHQAAPSYFARSFFCPSASLSAGAATAQAWDLPETMQGCIASTLEKSAMENRSAQANNNEPLNHLYLGQEIGWTWLPCVSRKIQQSTPPPWNSVA